MCQESGLESSKIGRQVTGENVWSETSLLSHGEAHCTHEFLRKKKLIYLSPKPLEDNN